MRKKSLDRTILTLAIPAIVANITTPLLSLVDIAIVGHLGSADFVAAIAVGATLFNMLYWLFGFLRFGTSGLTAQAVGRNDPNGQLAVGQQSLLLALAIGLALILLQWPLSHLAMWLLNPQGETRNGAFLYFNILIYGAPAVMIQYALNGWFVGSQNTRIPMWISIAINIINIAASLTLVFIFKMGLRGLALGTLIAQWAGAAIQLFAARTLLCKPTRNFNFRRFFSINADIFLRTLCLIAVTSWFTRAGANQGSTILAVNTLLLQLFTLFSYFMDGFAYAAEALCGKYVGAADTKGLRTCIRRIELWAGSVAAIFTAIYIIGGPEFLKILTNNTEILNASEPYRLWAAAIPAAGFMAFTWDGIVIGMTRTRLMLLSMAAATAIFFTLQLLLTPTIGNHALWISFLVYLLIRGLFLSISASATLKSPPNI